MTSWPAGSLVVAARAPGLSAGSAISTPSARSRSTSVSTSATTKESVTAEASAARPVWKPSSTSPAASQEDSARELTRARQPEVARVPVSAALDRRPIAHGQNYRAQLHAGPVFGPSAQDRTGGRRRPRLTRHPEAGRSHRSSTILKPTSGRPARTRGRSRRNGAHPTRLEPGWRAQGRDRQAGDVWEANRDGERDGCL